LVYFAARSNPKNVRSENDYIKKRNSWLAKIKAWVDEHGGGTIIPVSCTFEQKLADMSPEEAEASLNPEPRTLNPKPPKKLRRA
jgi:obg-like ATPase 1